MQQIFLMVQAMTNIVRKGAEEVRLEVETQTANLVEPLQLPGWKTAS